MVPRLHRKTLGGTLAWFKAAKALKANVGFFTLTIKIKYLIKKQNFRQKEPHRSIEERSESLIVLINLILLINLQVLTLSAKQKNGKLEALAISF